jgi:raffinose/stachyose/melibiose transport system substrate-binding protein
MYYNRTLWRSLFGDTPPPADYDEFIRLCDEVRAFSARTGRVLLPIAGSKDNAPPLIGGLFSAVTQRLALSLDRMHTLQATNTDVSLEFLRRSWDLDHPAIRAAFAISREAGLNFQPGYSQLGRDDASFYFMQGQALMITTGSWDSTSFRKLANFEIGVFGLPLPAPTHPKYGEFVFGPVAEGASTGLNFGIPRYTKNFDQTLDFLRYLGSQPVNQKFSHVSGWLPAVVGVKPGEHIAPFAPRELGYTGGFSIERLGADTRRIMSNANHILVSPAGSSEAMIAAIRNELPRTVRSDLERTQREAVKNISRQDVTLAARLWETEPAEAKVDQTLESQNRREAVHGWINFQLARTAAQAAGR